LPTEIAFVILIVSFKKTNALSGLQDQLSAFIVLLLLFGTSISSFTYILSFLFKTPSGAQISCIIINFILGFVLSTVGFILRLSGGKTSKAYMNSLRYIFCLLPPFALGDGVFNLCLREVFSLLELTAPATYKPFDWKISGLNICFMAFTSVLYLFITVMIEYLQTNKNFNSWRRQTIPPEGENTRDADVIAEEDRVNSGDVQVEQSSTILIKNFKHVYPGGKYAVRGVSLGIPNGECFGLLGNFLLSLYLNRLDFFEFFVGINGAGKSTTLSMLSGEFLPTTGEVYIAGINLLEEAQKCRRKIGFCPQFDSLFELLTAREHLYLYARFKGVY
jgi:ABC-type multidrug transport system fused ATPase/permease subunit